MRHARIAINGFGRMGRMVARIANLYTQFEIVAINDLNPPDRLAYALEFDSVHGVYPGKIEFSNGRLTIDGAPSLMLGEPEPAKLPWKELGVDYVVESTRERKLGVLAGHLEAGAARVVLTALPSERLKTTVVLGVNDHVITPDSRIISCASCTTNCAAPIAKVLHENFGIRTGSLTTIHAYTSSQHLVDYPHKDIRLSRSAATNIIPTSTGAAKAVGWVIPELDGKLDGMAMRVPVPNVSVVDFTVDVEQDTCKEDVNAAFEIAAAGDLEGILQFLTKPLVSSDIIGNRHSSVIDSELTRLVGCNHIKVIGWYDNESGYGSRVIDLITKLAQQDLVRA